VEAVERKQRIQISSSTIFSRPHLVKRGGFLKQAFRVPTLVRSFIGTVKRRRAIIAIAAAVLITAAVVIAILYINSRIEEERRQQEAAAKIDVKENALRPPAADGMTLFLNASEVRATVVYAGARYFATSGGLIALDDSGSVKRRYATLDGLPEVDLTALAVFRDRLFIGTAASGLLSFDGEQFKSHQFVKPRATRVSVLAATPSELLIGTLDGGMFEYDGERFTRRINSATGADFSRVTALLPVESRLYIGTHNSGLYIWREAQIEHLTTSEGLPSSHVTGLAVLPSSFDEAGSLAVATDFGVAVLDESNSMKPISSQPNVTSLAVSGGHLWAGLFNGGIVDLSSDHVSTRTGERTSGADAQSESSAAGALPRSAPCAVVAEAGTLWALTSEGAFAREAGSATSRFERVAGALVSERALTASHVTALALDGQGRLWTAYFDRGIDLLAPQTGELLSHIEDDRVREVNSLAVDPGADRMAAATSRGVVLFDGRLKQSALTRERDGLASDSVAHVTFVDAGVASSVGGASGSGPSPRSSSRVMVLATAGGLTEIRDGRARSLTAFHGLASNHLYASAAGGSRLFAGSLAGLIELEGLRVVRTYKTSNSRLAHDWVVALVEAGGTLYVGTNGGGVQALLPTGEWVDFESEIGRFEVNQNAMRYDGWRLYVGTSDRGLLVYDEAARRWLRISAGLPSQSVTAIASDDQFVYLGTLNGLVRIEKRLSE